jgi:hypothetical protein
MTVKPEIIKEIEQEVRARYGYSRFDFVFNHFLLMLVVAASSFPGFAQILDIDQPKATAIVAAIPAFVLLLQRTFKWEQRGEWHWDYRRRLKAILREVRDQGLSPEEASIKLNKLEQELAGSFPGVNYPASKEN